MATSRSLEEEFSTGISCCGLACTGVNSGLSYICALPEGGAVGDSPQRSLIPRTTNPKDDAMNDITFTVAGNVVKDVELRFTNSGDPVASFRVAMSSRRYDRATERWVDSDTHYFSVSCWRDLAHNVVQSITKGMPVVVYGKLRSREVPRPCGESSHIMRFHDIEAIAVGPDLSRGVATFTRVKRGAAVESEARAEADAAAAAGMIADELEAAGIVDDLPEDVDLETGEIRGEAA
ncbi:MAG: single-stranded DNA-binding protein [Actinobacteria bacterium]|uniref:Unannotated protein n=1 Tax=freshwater metagenome TaxID=449393 RepID=A0A6J7LSB5_9ZZZZ|nr:single-stranded DNA-binding protein [Actinomycetota bacterium]